MSSPRLLIFCLLFIGVSVTGISQRYISQPEKDIGSFSKADTIRVKTLNGLSFSLRESDREMAMEYSRQAYELSRKLGYEKGIGRALSNAGWIYYRKGDFVRSMENSYEALKISEKIGDKEEIARSLNNIGAIHFEQKQYQTSLRNFRKALALSIKINDKRTSARSLNNIGYLYLISKLNLDSARIYSEGAFTVSEKVHDPYLAAFALRTIGDVYERSKKYNSALSKYLQSSQLSKSSRNNAMYAATMRRIADVYTRQGKFDHAISILQENISNATLFSLPEELDRSYESIAEAHHAKGDVALAYDYLQMHRILHDSLFSERNSSKIAALQSTYDADMKQAQIELLTKEAALSDEVIITQRTRLYAVIGGCTFVVLLLIVLLISKHKVTKAKHKLELQTEELARKNEEIEQKSLELGKLNVTKDKIFSIIGHDLRSPLQSLKGLLELISFQNLSQEEFYSYSKDLKNKIDVIYVNLNNLLNWSVMQLQGIQTKPSVIDLSVLANEVFGLYTEVSNQKNVLLVNEIGDEVRAMADRDHIHLVLRNLLSNAIKFTPQEGLVRVTSEKKENNVEINIADSGVGIAGSDLEKLFIKDTLWTVNGTNNEKGLGLGLLLCKEFIEKNNGKLSVYSEVGIGTTFTVTLPIAATALQPELTQEYLLEAQPSIS
jgi:two-component system, sensor histidine kinase and response regulator